MTDFDFKKIDVVELLHELGMNNVHVKGHNAIFSCPFSGHINGDSSPSANMRLSDTVFYCYSCGSKGNAVSFLMELESCTLFEARQWLREKFNMSFREPPKEGFYTEIGKKLDRIEKRLTEDKPPAPTGLPIIPTEEVERRTIDWDLVWESWNSGKREESYPLGYMFDRGFIPKILDKFKIGWDTISQRIIIPIRDERGNYVGLKGRTPYDVKPKYKVLGGSEYGFEPYNVSRVLFNLDEFIREENTDLIVCEGELNTIALHQRGYTTAVGVSGKVISDQHIEIIKKYATSVTFLFDELSDSLSAAKSLEKSMPTYFVDEHSKDPAEMTGQEIVKLIASAKSIVMV